MKLLKDRQGGETAMRAAEELKRMALYKGRTHEQIAEAVGLHRPSVNDKLNGRARLTLDEFVAMSYTIGVNPVEVLEKATSREDSQEVTHA